MYKELKKKPHTTTKMLKHLYDSKPAEEYEFILHNLVSIIKYPDEIYKNKDSKRGTTEEMNFVVTAFKIRKDSYLQNYKLLWSWKGDIPSS